MSPSARCTTGMRIAALLAAASAAAAAPCFVVTTAAGTGEAGFAGDGGPATAAQLNSPSGVTFTRALSASGAPMVIIGDTSNRRMRLLDVSRGTLTTLAGSGEAEGCRDGGRAVDGCLWLPVGSAVDADGNVFIAETWGGRVRALPRSLDTLVTLAGNSTRNTSGDGGAANAATTWPMGLALDLSGDLVIVEANAHCVRRVTLAAGQPRNITRLAGQCVGSDWGNGGFGGDGGPATSALVNTPYGVAVNPVTGDVYFSDRVNHRVRVVDASTGVIRTVAGTGQYGWNGDGAALDTNLHEPSGLAWSADGATLYIADTFTNVLRSLAGGNVTTVAGVGGAPAGYSGDGGPALNARFSAPFGVAVDPLTGALWVVDNRNNALRALSQVDCGAA